MIKAEKQIAKIKDLIARYRKESQVGAGSCATGIKDYRHSHSWASDCYSCVERGNKGKIADLLEETLKD